MSVMRPAPNTRTQRIRSSPSAPRSPLTRNPLGGRDRQPAICKGTWCVVAVLLDKEQII
jgi:hypothetical protein